MRHCPTEYPKKRPLLHACPRPGKLKAWKFNVPLVGPRDVPCRAGSNTYAGSSRNGSFEAKQGFGFYPNPSLPRSGRGGRRFKSDSGPRRAQKACPLQLDRCRAIGSKNRISGRRSRRELFCGSSFCGAAPRTCICLFGMFRQRLVLMPLPCAVSTFPTARAASRALP